MKKVLPKLDQQEASENKLHVKGEGGDTKSGSRVPL